MSTTTVRIHIDELVLHGFDARSRHAIGDAVQAELQRQFALDPAFARRLRSDHPDAGSMAFHRLAAPAVTLSANVRRDGRAIGAAIYRSVAAADLGTLGSTRPAPVPSGATSVKETRP